MRLVIRAKSLKHERLSQTIVGEFDERGGTIGRSDSNTMALPDPERHVSRLQAEITFAVGTFSIRNVGSSNPIIVNGRPVSPGEAAALRNGDSMTIGGYEMQVSSGDGAPAGRGVVRPVDARTVIGASAGEGRTNPPRQPAAPAVGSGAASDPFAGLLGAPALSGASDPFADLMSAPTRPPTQPPPPRPPERPPPAAAARLPDDFDPFADLAAPAPPAAPPSSRDSSLADLVGDRRSSPGSLDSVFDLNPAAPGQGDPMDQFLAPTLPPGAPSPSDPFAFLESVHASTRREPVGPAAADHTPALQGAYKPPPVRGAEPDISFSGPTLPPPHVAPARAAPSADDSDALWRAFCDGAQLNLPGRQRLTPELMRVIGATLKNAIEGTVQLAAARTTTKQELHVPVTTIQTKNNNPLKFAPDAASALAMLLQPPLRGFMAAPEAVQDAMADLLGHTVGTMAGTRAAMDGMLHRFEPARLEKQLAAGGILDALLPMNRRANLWELYLQHYERISEGAREDFHELFGKAFVKAYEEQADRIAAASRARR